jgi:hypothetical protein
MFTRCQPCLIADFLAMIREICAKQAHHRLQEDIAKHLWVLKGNAHFSDFSLSKLLYEQFDFVV